MIAALGGCTDAVLSARRHSGGGDYVEARVLQYDAQRAQDLDLVVADEHARAAHAIRSVDREPRALERVGPDAAAVALHEPYRDRKPRPDPRPAASGEVESSKMRSS